MICLTCIYLDFALALPYKPCASFPLYVFSIFITAISKGLGGNGISSGFIVALPKS